VTIVYSPRYHIDIGRHVFPTNKYRLVYERIQQSHPETPVIEPDPAAWEELGLVHTPEYLHKIRTGSLDLEELAQLEIPWAPETVEGFRLMTGGTLTAARLAVNDTSAPAPIVFHIGGGFHHAFANHGEGFCLFNDVAVAIRMLQAAARVERAAVIDLDVHHGNGTAVIFERDPRVFTFSMHQQHNYPMHRPRGSLDIGLADGASDAEGVRSGAADRVLSRWRRSVRGRRPRRAGAQQSGTSRARWARAGALHELASSDRRSVGRWLRQTPYRYGGHSLRNVR
jgi:acetoin utilization deacetylase AcuC-like enzyme